MSPDAKKVYLLARRHPYKLERYIIATSCQRENSERWGMRFVMLRPISRKGLERCYSLFWKRR